MPTTSLMDRPTEDSSGSDSEIGLPSVNLRQKQSSIVPSDISVQGTLSWRNLVEHFPLGNASDLFDADGSNMSGPANGPGAARSKQWRAVAAALRNESRRNSDARAAELLQQLLARDLAEAILGQDPIHPGWPLLHLSCAFGRTECVRLLLAAGAPATTLLDRDNRLAAEVASQFRSTSCEALLAKHTSKKRKAQRSAAAARSLGHQRRTRPADVNPNRKEVLGATEGIRRQRKEVNFRKASAPINSDVNSSQESVCSVNSASSRRLDNWYTALGSRRQRQGNPTELYGVVDGSKHECKGVTGSDGRRYNVWIKKHVPIEKDEEGVLLMEAENACSLDRHDHLKLPEIEAKPMLQD